MKASHSVACGKSSAWWSKEASTQPQDDWPQLLLIETNALSARAPSAFNACHPSSQPFVVENHFQTTFVRQTVNNSALSLSPWIKSKILFTSERNAFHVNNRRWNRSLTASVCEWLQLYPARSNKAHQHSPRVFIYNFYTWPLLQMVTAGGGGGGVASPRLLQLKTHLQLMCTSHFCEGSQNFRPEKVIVAKVTWQISH
jgi:hypothetical protein